MSKLNEYTASNFSTEAMRRFSQWLHRGPFPNDDAMWEEFNRNHSEHERNMFYDTWIYNLGVELWEENKALKVITQKIDVDIFFLIQENADLLKKWGDAVAERDAHKDQLVNTIVHNSIEKKRLQDIISVYESVIYSEEFRSLTSGEFSDKIDEEKKRRGVL